MFITKCNYDEKNDFVYTKLCNCNDAPFVDILSFYVTIAYILFISDKTDVFGVGKDDICNINYVFGVTFIPDGTSNPILVLITLPINDFDIFAYNISPSIDISLKLSNPFGNFI